MALKRYSHACFRTRNSKLMYFQCSDTQMSKYTWNYMDFFIDPYDGYNFTGAEKQIFLDLLTSNIRHTKYSADLPTLEQYSDSFTIESFSHPHLMQDTRVDPIILWSDGLDYEAQQEHTISSYIFYPNYLEVREDWSSWFNFIIF